MSRSERGMRTPTNGYAAEGTAARRKEASDQEARAALDHSDHTRDDRLGTRGAATIFVTVTDTDGELQAIGADHRQRHTSVIAGGLPRHLRRRWRR